MSQFAGFNPEGDRDMERRLVILAKAAMKFRRRADALLNATASVSKHNPGVAAFYRAVAKMEKANAEYDAASAHLTSLCDDLAGVK